MLETRNLFQLTGTKRETLQLGHVDEDLRQIDVSQVEAIELQHAQFLQRVTREEFQGVNVLVAGEDQLLQIVAQETQEISIDRGQGVVLEIDAFDRFDVIQGG